MYLATVQIGTPPRNFSVVVDSGSADFWVGGEDCKSEKGSDCVGTVCPTTICSNAVLTPRVLTPSLAIVPHPLSMTPERPGPFDMVPVLSTEPSSPTTLRSPA